MKYLCILLLSCLALFSSKAQTKHKFPGYVFLQGGLLNGSGTVSGQGQLVAGLQTKAWMFGLGVAVDYYKVRTVPVFADIRYSFGQQRNFFAYADLGSSIPWALQSQHSEHYVLGAMENDKFIAGLYSDIGVGYATRGGKKGALLISAGYSIKKLTTSYMQQLYNTSYSLAYYEYRSDYTFNRAVLKIGLRL